MTSITDWIQFTLFSINLLSQVISSAERILEFANPKPEDTEEHRRVALDKKLIANNWPSNGTIRAQNLQCRYRSNTPLVLKGIDFEI